MSRVLCGININDNDVLCLDIKQRITIIQVGHVHMKYNKRALSDHS